MIEMIPSMEVNGAAFVVKHLSTHTAVGLVSMIIVANASASSNQGCLTNTDCSRSQYCHRSMGQCTCYEGYNCELLLLDEERLVLNGS